METIHSVYARASEEYAKRQASAYPGPAWLTTAEAAKLLRERLKRDFPGVKFSVRSESYSGGSSIRVRWSGGPDWRAVQAVADQYQFAGFDGMIDMQYFTDRWLLPDGTLLFASTRGTEGSGGSVPARECKAPRPDAIRVRGGASFVSCCRD